MLHSKFQRNRSTGSGEEILYKVFTINHTMHERGGHHDHITQMLQTNTPTHRGSTQNMALTGQLVSVKMFEHRE